MIVTAAYILSFAFEDDTESSDPGEGIFALVLLAAFMAFDLHMAQVMF